MNKCNHLRFTWTLLPVSLHCFILSEASTRHYFLPRDLVSHWMLQERPRQRKFCRKSEREEEEEKLISRKILFRAKDNERWCLFHSWLRPDASTHTKSRSVQRSCSPSFRRFYPYKFSSLFIGKLDVRVRRRRFFLSPTQSLAKKEVSTLSSEIRISGFKKQQKKWQKIYFSFFFFYLNVRTKEKSKQRVNYKTIEKRIYLALLVSSKNVLRQRVEMSMEKALIH